MAQSNWFGGRPKESGLHKNLLRVDQRVKINIIPLKVSYDTSIVVARSGKEVLYFPLGLEEFRIGIQGKNSWKHPSLLKDFPFTVQDNNLFKNGRRVGVLNSEKLQLTGEFTIILLKDKIKIENKCFSKRWQIQDLAEHVRGFSGKNLVVTLTPKLFYTKKQNRRDSQVLPRPDLYMLVTQNCFLFSLPTSLEYVSD